jgi:hypothetical protein
VKSAADKSTRKRRIKPPDPNGGLDPMRYVQWQRPRCPICEGVEFKQMRGRTYDGATVAERVECCNEDCRWRGILLGS